MFLFFLPRVISLYFSSLFRVDFPPSSMRCVVLGYSPFLRIRPMKREMRGHLIFARVKVTWAVGHACSVGNTRPSRMFSLTLLETTVCLSDGVASVCLDLFVADLAEPY